MTTLFEVLVAGHEAEYAQGLAREIFDEIDRMEGILSRFDPTSDVGQINRLKPGEVLRVGHETMAVTLSAEEVRGRGLLPGGPIRVAYRPDRVEWL